MSTKLIKEVIKKAGNQTKLAQTLGISQCTISQWIRRQSTIPPQYVIKIEKMTGISRHILRPDIYPTDNHD